MPRGTVADTTLLGYLHLAASVSGFPLAWQELPHDERRNKALDSLRDCRHLPADGKQALLDRDSLPPGSRGPAKAGPPSHPGHDATRRERPGAAGSSRDGASSGSHPAPP